MTVLDAALKVLEESKGPLPAAEIANHMIENGYWTTAGLTPAATVQARLAVDVKSNPKTKLVRTEPGVYGLKERDRKQPEPARDQVPLCDLITEEDQRTGSTKFLDAAEQVLEVNGGGPMRVKDIIAEARKNYGLQTAGKTPWETLRVMINREIGRREERGMGQRFKVTPLGIQLLSGSTMSTRSEKDSKVEEVLQQIRRLSAEQFEDLVTAVFQRRDGFEVVSTPRSKDGGLDTIGTFSLTDEFDIEVGIQTKHWKNPVGRPEVQSLRGSLPVRAVGILVSLSGFTEPAKDDCRWTKSSHPIHLIDGQEFAWMMVEKSMEIGPDGQLVPVE